MKTGNLLVSFENQDFHKCCNAIAVMSVANMMDAFIAALLKKDNKRTEVDRFDIAQFLRCAGLYHSKILQSVS